MKSLPIWSITLALLVTAHGCAHKQIVPITPLPFRVMSTMAALPAGHDVSWQSQPQTLYWLELSTNLIDWAVISMEQTGDGTMESVTVQDNGPMGFYRLGSRTIPIMVPYEAQEDMNRVVTMKHRGE